MVPHSSDAFTYVVFSSLFQTSNFSVYIQIMSNIIHRCNLQFIEMYGIIPIQVYRTYTEKSFVFQRTRHVKITVYCKYTVMYSYTMNIMYGKGHCLAA